MLECLLVMTLTVLLLLSVVTAYRSFVSKHQLSLSVDQLTHALEYARDTAITTQSTITFCARRDDETCGSDWSKGQLILNERTQQVLRVLSALPLPYQLIWRSTLGDSARLRWRSDGFTRGQQGSFDICTKRTNVLLARIVVLRTGRLRVVRSFAQDKK